MVFIWRTEWTACDSYFYVSHMLYTEPQLTSCCISSWGWSLRSNFRFHFPFQRITGWFYCDRSGKAVSSTQMTQLNVRWFSSTCAFNLEWCDHCISLVLLQTMQCSWIATISRLKSCLFNLKSSSLNSLTGLSIEEPLSVRDRKQPLIASLEHQKRKWFAETPQSHGWHGSVMCHPPEPLEDGYLRWIQSKGFISTCKIKPADLGNDQEKYWETLGLMCQVIHSSIHPSTFQHVGHLHLNRKIHNWHWCFSFLCTLCGSLNLGSINVFRDIIQSTFSLQMLF